MKTVKFVLLFLTIILPTIYELIHADMSMRNEGLFLQKGYGQYRLA